MNDLLTNLQRHQFQAAQASYESREAPEFDEDDDKPAPFNDEWVDAYINGLAAAEDAAEYLEEDGVEVGEQGQDVAKLLQTLAVGYQEKREQLADLVGSRFFQTMKALASVAYGNQQ